MPELVVGGTRIPYVVRWSPVANRRRVVVTPDRVEVVAPAGSGEAGVESFLHRKRRWIYEQVEAVRTAAARVEPPLPTRYATGAKILYRGRRVRLTVERLHQDGIEVEFRNGFQVRAGANATDRDLQAALERWMHRKVHEGVAALVWRHARRLGVAPRGIRVKAMSGKWASCGAGGLLHFDRRLIHAPKAVFEYAVVHELVHLLVRRHGPAFWRRVAEILPGYRAEAAALAALGGTLG